MAALATLTVSASGGRATGDVRAVSFADHTVRQYVQTQAKAEGFFEVPLDPPGHCRRARPERRRGSNAVAFMREASCQTQINELGPWKFVR